MGSATRDNLQAQRVVCPGVIIQRRRSKLSLPSLCKTSGPDSSPAGVNAQANYQNDGNLQDWPAQFARIEAKLDQLLAGEPLNLTQARLARLEAKLDRLMGGPPAEYIRVMDAMALTSCRSYSAFYRLVALLDVRPVVHGKYRLKELENALARKH